MFKLGVITDEISQDFELALDRMVEWGIPHAEIRGLWNKNVSDLTTQEIDRAMFALDDRDLTVCGVASPFYKCELTGGSASDTGRLHLAEDRVLADQLDVLKRCIETARRFETNFVRVFAFWRRGETTPEIFDRIVELFHEPLRIAREEGITLLLENEHDCYMSTGTETAAFMARLAPEGLRAVWDPGNAFCGSDEAPYPTGYEAMKPYVAHVHLKDPVRKPDGEVGWVAMGSGEVDWVGQLRALKSDGYTGILSIETHYAPQGGTPEEGTRETLGGLKSVIERAGDAV